MIFETSSWSITVRSIRTEIIGFGCNTGLSETPLRSDPEAVANDPLELVTDSSTISDSLPVATHYLSGLRQTDAGILRLEHKNASRYQTCWPISLEQSLAMNGLTFVTPLPLRVTRSTRNLTSSRTPPVSVAYRSRRSENVEGNIYVDSSCIDCDICRWLAPDTFTRANSKSAVYSQPQNQEEKLRALQAMTSCPTGSIRTETPEPLTKDVVKSFPVPATDKNGNEVQGVYFNGYASEFTFGASSWLAITSDTAVIFDCPRFSEKLAKGIERIVGDRTLYLALSHRDDVHGHVQWANRLKCLRIIHAAECNRSQMTHQCEIKLHDSDFPYTISDGITLLHTPGHSKGSICLYHEQTRSLFSGDHVAFSNRVGRLVAFKPYNSFSWNAQIQSITSLTKLDFKYIWPGHGRKIEFADENERRSQLQALMERMKASTESYV